MPRAARKPLQKSLPEIVDELFCRLNRIKCLFEWKDEGQIARPVHVLR